MEYRTLELAGPWAKDNQSSQDCQTKCCQLSIGPEKNSHLSTIFIINKYLCFSSISITKY